MAKSIIQAEKECYICRRWYAVKTTRGLEEHHILNGPLRSFSERHGLKVWLCHRHHNEPGLSAAPQCHLCADLKGRCTSEIRGDRTAPVHTLHGWPLLERTISMLNVVAIMGRLVADPELRTTPAGVNVCQLPHCL